MAKVWCLAFSCSACLLLGAEEHHQQANVSTSTSQGRPPMTSNTCVLGYASYPWSLERGSWHDTHIGGHAIWPDGPQPNIDACPRCKSSRFLMLQAYAPHSAHANRFLLLFACNSSQCSRHSDTWLAWRVCQKSSSPPVSHTTSNLVSHQYPGTNSVSINWDDDDDDDDDSDSDGGSTDTDDDVLTEQFELLSLQAELARKKQSGTAAGTNASKPPARPSRPTSTIAKAESDADLSQQQPVNGSQHSLAGECSSFPGFFVEVEEEPTKPAKSSNQIVNRLLQKYIQDEKNRPSTDASENWVPEQDDEETPVKHALQIFQETLSKAPTQILRYAFGAQPIWPTHPPPTSEKIAKCACGSPLVFELQLLGSCLHFLQVDSCIPSTSDTAMSFTTLALYTCADDCSVAPVLRDTPTYQAFQQSVHILQDDC